MNKATISVAIATTALMMSAQSHAELSANIGVTNNYLWRGLTQSTNEPAVQGGIDYSHESGLYIGTWASNVQYESDDVYSYEHDMYIGFSGEAGELSYDIGYLYYNYDSDAEFDFGEVYGSIGMGGFSFSASFLANTEADEVDDQDFSALETYYLSGDYTMELSNGAELTFHVGYHDGDFSEAFNGVSGDYYDYSVTLAKSGFAFTISDTDLDDDGSFATTGARDNDEMKFVVSYTLDIEM
jgi:uncharacterized protein (TIGR02001 family)